MFAATISGNTIFIFSIPMKTAMVIISILLGLYILLCLLLFLFQENIIFLPQKLSQDHRFTFRDQFEERHITMDDGTMLHGLLFKADGARGLIFYLHGNAGSLEGWGDVGEIYTPLGYDIFLLDYRGYGKSEGVIKTEPQLFQDVQTAYTEMLKEYKEDDIVVLGYSIGTGMATKLASGNNPRMLILQAPYYSLTDVTKKTFPFVPTFLLRYKLETFRYITGCTMPVVIIHGDQDEVIPYAQAVKLKSLLKEADTLITISGLGHNGMTHHEEYEGIIKRVLLGN